MTKRNVFFVGLAGTLLILFLFSLETSSCYSNISCLEFRRFFNRQLTFIPPYLFFLPIPIFTLSLITYKMRDEVFRAWWNFARWWAPVIVVVTLLLENAGGGGTLGMNKDFTAFILIILYSILVITSLVKIMNAYLKTKEG